MDIELIKYNNTLTEELLGKYKDILDWSSLSTNKELTAKFIDKY